MKTKRFIPGVPVHSYEKGADGNVLFYCLRDRLVYYTIFSIEAEKYNITVLSLCIMFNHTHSLTQAENYVNFFRFHQSVESQYAKSLNNASDRNGRVFKKPFGWALKRSAAKVKDCLAYLANNPVVKKLCKKGVDDRWTFLAYGKSSHPFSETIVLKKASAALRRGIKLVKATHERRQALNYALLNRIYSRLNEKEANQMTDFIISTYMVIDFDKASAYFGGYDQMIAAFDIISGSEYDIQEDHSPEPDIAYREMIQTVHKAGYNLVRKPFLHCDSDTRVKLSWLLLQQTSASPRQVARFLHLKTKK